MEYTLTRIVNYIVSVADPEAILLFGSVAHGCANIYSDVDLLVVTQESTMKNFITEKVACFIKELGLKSDVLVYSTTELERAILQPSSFLCSITKTSKILYKKQEKILLELNHSLTL
jgi:predicted nucleotidyltransferase